MYLIVSLFLYLQSMPVTLAYCDEEKLVFMQEEEMIEASIFNIAVDQEDWEQVCQYLEQAEQLRLEKETLIHEESFDVYIWADEKLLQQVILEKEWGRSLINHPEYQYAKKMKKEEMIAVIAPNIAVSTHKVAIAVLTILFLILAILVFIFVKI